MSAKCPGQNDRNIKAEIIRCLACGSEVEIFSDEVKINCPRCRGSVAKENLPSCVDWCKAARECIGKERWHKLKGGT